MSVPTDIDSRNFQGVYVLNKGQSDSFDDVLRVQGMGWAKRKVVSSATPTLYIKHFKDSDGNEHVQTTQEGPMGLKGGSEERMLDGSRIQQESPAFGPVLHSIQRARVDELDSDWQKEGWSLDTIEHGVILARLEGDTSKGGKSWVTSQVWGFADIEGERKHVRKVHAKGSDEETIMCRLVYDYQGQNTKA